MIDTLEIRNENRIVIGIIDTAKSVIWHSVYYGVGDFEIYAQADPHNLALLEVDNYVTRQNNDEVGIIASVEIQFSIQEGYMIIARGRFAKSLLERRLIFNLSGSVNKATILSGNVESAIRQVVSDNAIDCSFDSRRNLPVLELGASAGLTATIIDGEGDSAQKQVSYQNLLDYTDGVLQEYRYSSKVIYNDSNGKLQYVCFEGVDRSTDNDDGNEPMVFAVDFDNLNSSDYLYDESTLRNTALIGGEGEGLARFYALLTGGQSGLDLREIFVDAASVNKTYRDSSDFEHTYTDAQYRSMLKQKGAEELAQLIVTENFSGDINTSFGLYKYGVDYGLGDIITVQDNYIGKYINTRITEATEVQDENGYRIDVVFGS
ncbi:MAG: siphovirus ReqiPepy6 Gp37-like family protein [Exiguobacterium sp.]|nr:siphovirus ReqiPepy6 Gp37-like family protein [Exiguobacterium sp.]